MSKKNKRKAPVAGNLPKTSKIVASPVYNQNLSFSFKYVDTGSSVFTLKNQQMRYIFLIIERLKEFSAISKNTLISNRNDKSTRFHPINWKDTAYPKGFSIKETELWQEKSYQFSLGKSKGRIAGFLIDSVFYIVWVDPKHKIYPMYK